jgi:hypothetical protein
MGRRAFGMMPEPTHGCWNWFLRARREFVAAAHQRPGRLQSVKQALPMSIGISQNLHNPL